MTTQPAILRQHLCCTNDTNGNPRRVWVSYRADGSIADIRDEGYEGTPESMRQLAELPAVSITPAEYREWLDREENQHGRFAVVEAAHDNSPECVWRRCWTADRARRYRRTQLAWMSSERRHEHVSIVEFPH